MADIQPKMQYLQKKYADNREELGRQMQDLYKKEGYNPMMGCLPLLIQMPILMSLFGLLRNPGQYVEGVQLVVASHESFMWLSDLSQPDLWLLPIVCGITTFASMSMTGMAGAGASDQSAQTQPMMKMMKYFMPVFIVVMARSMPAGLAVYWFIGNLFTVGQTWLLKNMRKKAETEVEKTKKALT
jgi:YidC/Oxa1 family membrane protein insertase